MLNKTLYIPLIMALLGLQAGLQTATGQDASEQPSPQMGFYTFQSISPPKDVKIQGMGTEGIGITSTTPQACSGREGHFWVQNYTDYRGDAYWSCEGCYFRAPVCSTLQTDWPHRMTAALEQNSTRLHVVSWAPWYSVPAGPIWYACYVIVCY